MTNFRAFFILREDEVLLSRRFPIIEKKIEHLADNFTPLPSDTVLLPMFLSVFQIDVSSKIINKKKKI